ncbi:hypothetical protein [Acinetobacter thermotolerans]|uniref:hypothetical protein n=1 Tax=Acinetobacter thermotolerans TaxID=3151487 RepID=UPI00325B8417
MVDFDDDFDIEEPYHDDDAYPEYVAKNCNSCKGSGYDVVDGKQCAECLGSGKVSKIE